MEETVVRHCLKKQLDWLKELPPERGDNQAEIEAISRADLWLEKLIQIRLHVSAPTEQEYEEMIRRGSGAEDHVQDSTGTRREESDFDWLSRAFGRATRAISFILLLVLVIGGTVWGTYKVARIAGSRAAKIHIEDKEKETKKKEAKERAEEEKMNKTPPWLHQVQLTGTLNEQQFSARLLPTSTPVPEKPTTPPPTAATAVEGSASTGISNRASERRSAESSRPAETNWSHVAIIFIAALAASRWILGIRDQETIRDSQTFADTLKQFEPCIRAACPTPRAVKHLINRVRLYAMLLRYWDNWKERRDREDNAEMAARERSLVIFGILERLIPTELERSLSSGTQIQLGEKLRSFEEPANGALDALTTRFSQQFTTLLRTLGKPPFLPRG